MKPSNFEYYSPETLGEALSLLAEHGDEAKVLAGGQSLVPSMNFRLAQPSILVDLNGIDELFGISVRQNDALEIRAMTRQRTVERDERVARLAPLITEAMPHIAHPQIRNRGTFGGSLAHADPAAELPALMVALDAEMHLQSSRGERVVPASEFFQGLFTTALEPDEVLASVHVPPVQNGVGTAFEEFARRHGDYALAGAAAWVLLDTKGKVAESRLVLFSVGDVPILSGSASGVLKGETPNDDLLLAAAEAIEADIDPQADIHATAPYRKHLAKVLARRVLQKATQRAGDGSHH